MDDIPKLSRPTWKQKITNYRLKTIYFIKELRHLSKEDIKRYLKKSPHVIKYAILIGITILVLIPIFTYLYFIRDMTSKEKIINKKNGGIILLDRNEKPFFTLFEARTKKTIPLSDIPVYTQKAFIAIEDKDFYKHPGFSISGIGRAIKTNLTHEEYAAGGSTISQQLIKNTLLSPDKRLLRKYQELILALELERRYSKDDILEMYLNTNYFGEGAFGIEDASQRYFSKSAKNLTLAESALLAAIIKAPSALSPLTGDLDAALKRQRLVLSLMREQGYITENQKTQAENQKIVFNPSRDELNNEAVHFALMVQDALIKKYGEQNVAQSGFVVKTTLDTTLQTVAEKAVENQVERLAGSKVSNGAAVVINPKNGEVLALVGSHDWSDTENGKINMAARPRQPGSSFKPIIYAKAFEERLITPASELDDKKVKFGSYEPHDYDRKYRGEVLARYALANSLNIPAVHVMDMVGVRDGIKAAQDLGITTLDEDRDYGLPFVLGAAEVPLIEMTNVYAAFANKGVQYNPILYTEVRDKNGKTIDTLESKSHRSLPESVAFLISSILSDNKARADTFGTALTISRVAAVKTGTTEDYKDALTIGYTPQVAVGVWIGNNDNTSMTSIAGSLGAAPIWRQIMESALRGKPVEKFQKPRTVADELVCFEDGLKAEYATSSAYQEFFLAGTVPSKLCDLPSPTPTPGEKKDEDKKDDQKPTDTPTPTTSQKPTATPIQIQTTPVLPSPTPEKNVTPTPTPETIAPILP